MQKGARIKHREQEEECKRGKKRHEGGAEDERETKRDGEEDKRVQRNRNEKERCA
mgnify:CR=1 FL=1